MSSKTITINKIPVEFQSTENGFFSSTKDIADVFGKEPKAINKIIRKFPNFGALVDGGKIAPVKYRGENGEMRPMYMLDRDIHNLVIMGFTGEKAYWWKVAFIDAFNLMEKMIFDERNKELIELQKKVENTNTYQKIDRQLITDDKLSEFAQGDRLGFIRRSTLVTSDTRADIYKKIEAPRDAEIEKIKLNYENLIRHENQQATIFIKGFNRDTNIQIKKIRASIQALIQVGNKGHWVEELYTEIKELEKMKVSEHNRVIEEYNTKKGKLLAKQDMEIVIKTEEFKREIEVRKEMSEKRIMIQAQLIQDYQDGKAIHEEVYAFLNESFDPMTINIDEEDLNEIPF